MEHSPSALLRNALPGSKLRVERLEGSRELRTRLYSMGILPGTELEVSGSSQGKGCVCVHTRHGSLLLDKAVSEAILCAEEGATCPLK